MFSCEYCKSFKNIYFEEDLRTTASSPLLISVFTYLFCFKRSISMKYIYCKILKKQCAYYYCTIIFLQYRYNLNYSPVIAKAIYVWWYLYIKSPYPFAIQKFFVFFFSASHDTLKARVFRSNKIPLRIKLL